MAHFVTKISDIIEFNPRESIAKKQLCKKVPMEYLQPFTRQISGFEEAPYAGGTKFRNNDTIMARITPCLENGKTAFVKGFAENEVVFGSTEYIVMRAIPGHSDPTFIYYLATSPSFREVAIKSMVGSSGRQRVQQDVLKNLELVLPDYETQVRVGKVLSAFDDKIELNTQINHNLEEQAKAIFKSWFVDFEPFADDVFTNEDPVEHPASLSMVQIANIEHILETGKRPKGGAVKSGIPSIGAENVKKLGVFDYSSGKFIPREFADSMKRGKINGYELLIYKDGGKPGTFIPHFSMFGEGYPYEECYINEHVFKLDFGNKGFNAFAYFYFQTDYPYSWLANNGGKAAIPGINQEDIRSIFIFDPQHPKVKEFSAYVSPIFTTIMKNCLENKKLAQLRDALLPKLMSGEIDVSEVEV